MNDITGEKKTALVVGGMGFIGSHLVERLMASGFGVVVMDDLSSSHILGESTWLDAPDDLILAPIDVRLPIPDYVGSFDYIFHVATSSRRRAVEDDPVRTTMTAVLGMINLAEHAMKTKDRTRLVLCTETITEPMSSFDELMNAYHSGLAAAESIASAYRTKEDLNTLVVTLPPVIYGPRSKGTTNPIDSIFSAGKIYRSDTTPLLHVRDAAKYIIAAALNHNIKLADMDIDLLERVPVDLIRSVISGSTKLIKNELESGRGYSPHSLIDFTHRYTDYVDHDGIGWRQTIMFENSIEELIN